MELWHCSDDALYGNTVFPYSVEFLDNRNLPYHRMCTFSAVGLFLAFEEYWWNCGILECTFSHGTLPCSFSGSSRMQWHILHLRCRSVVLFDKPQSVHWWFWSHSAYKFRFAPFRAGNKGHCIHTVIKQIWLNSLLFSEMEGKTIIENFFQETGDEFSLILHVIR